MGDCLKRRLRLMLPLCVKLCKLSVPSIEPENPFQKKDGVAVRMKKKSRELQLLGSRKIWGSYQTTTEWLETNIKFVRLLADVLGLKMTRTLAVCLRPTGDGDTCGRPLAMTSSALFHCLVK